MTISRQPKILWEGGAPTLPSATTLLYAATGEEVSDGSRPKIWGVLLSKPR